MTSRRDGKGFVKSSMFILAVIAQIGHVETNISIFNKHVYKRSIKALLLTIHLKKRDILILMACKTKLLQSTFSNVALVYIIVIY